MILTETEINKISGGSVDYFDRIVFARAVESALLEKLRAGVEVPEPAGWMNKNGDVFSKKEAVGFNTSTMKPLCTVEAALQYGAAQRLAAREQQWLPIESAPKDGTAVLLYFPHKDLVIRGVWEWQGEGDWETGQQDWKDWCTDNDVVIQEDPSYAPTHWAPCIPLQHHHRSRHEQSEMPVLRQSLRAGDWCCDLSASPRPIRKVLLPMRPM